MEGEATRITVLTNNGVAFADQPKNRIGPNIVYMGLHILGRTYKEHGITHKLTKPYHPWNQRQAERMNRTIKDATLRAFQHSILASLKAHVLAFVAAYNFAKHLKTLRWRTPFEAIVHAWTADPSTFRSNPRHLIPRPHT